MGLPIPNLDDKTFDELVKEARSVIARYAPDWTDHNVHDPGITFIELFVWLAEMQIYQLNQVTDTHYQKFLKLVGLYPFDAQPAALDITLEKVTSEKRMEAGTQVTTEVGPDRIVFEIEEDLNLIPVSLEKVITTYASHTIDNTEANQKGDIYFAPFGEKALEGAKLKLGFNEHLPEKEIQITFVLFEEDLPPVGGQGDEQLEVIHSVDLVWEYLDGGIWKTLAVKKDNTLALSRSGRIVFDGPPSMEKKDDRYWIRCRLKGGSYEIIPQINRIRLNIISAVQIETIKNEDLGTGLEIPGHNVLLKKTPVIMGSQLIQVQGVNGEWEDWEEADDFESSAPDDPHYRFDTEKGKITFGNGLNGRIPLESQKIRAALYKTTLGQKGNIPKGQTFWINKEGFEGIFGKNLKEATGGKEAESIEGAKVRAKKDFRIHYRAITSHDYEQLALATPGLRVARAKAIPNYNPEYPCIAIPGTVTVVVVPYAREETVTPVPGKGFLQTVKSHLDEHRLVTTDLHVAGPKYVEISTKCKVHIKKRSSPTEVEQRVRKALERFLDPLKGGPDEKGWPFGRSVFPSEIYQMIDKVEGVDYATGVSISAEGQYQKTGNTIKIPPIALVFSGKHQLEVK